MGEPSHRRMFSEIMATGLEKPIDDTEAEFFTNPRKNLAAVFKKSSSNVEAGEEHMKCYLRIRPFSEAESEKGENQECIDILDDNTILTKAPKESHTFKHYAHGLGKTSHKFTFSRIFDEDTTQKEFFDDTMLSLVRDFIDGQNCLVFTYGVTSSGKTYTIQGKQSDAGILPRVLDVLFNSINNKQLQGVTLKPKMFMDVTKLSSEETEVEKKIKDRIMKMSLEDDSNVMMLLGEDASDISQGNTTTCSESSNMSTVDRESKESLVDVFDIENRIREETKLNVEDQGQIRFSIWCSFAEIYNEQIFDLLEPMPKKKNAKRPVLRLSDDKNGSPYIKGLKEVNVTNADEAYKLLNIGQRNLSTACTKLNHSSSRSHCIFNIKIIRVLDNGNPKMARVSMLSLCDLAGSERSSKTLSQGDRLKEAGNINTSLMTLGRCIEMLRFNQNHKENNRIIPFRDSKLTRLFQNFFCGRGKAAMIVNVNQCASMFDETLHVFKFSAIAKQVVVHQKPDISKPKTIAGNKTLPSREPSIMWDTPGAMMKYNSQFAETTEEDDTEDENLDVSMSELQEALNIIEHLQNQLSEERKERAMMEARIREEVCKEMMQQIVSIEENYNDMLRENKIQQEEIVEERVKMLMESIHRPRKRARGDKNDENTDEWVPAIRLKAEEFKVKDLNEKCERMGKEITELNAEVFRLTKTNESMTKLQTSLEFKLADSKSNLTQLTTQKDKDERKVHELEKTNQNLTKNIEELRQQVQHTLAASGYTKEEIANSEFIDVLSQQLQQAKDTVHEQETTIEELGETLQQKNEEIGKLMEAIEEDEKKLEKQAEVISEMHNMLEESKTAVESSQTRIQDKDQRILGLEASCSEKQVEIEKLTKQLAELENGRQKDPSQSCNLDLKSELKKTEAEMEKLNEVLIDKDEEIVSLQSKLKNEEQESFKRHQALINGYNAEITSYKTQTLELRAKLSGFQKTDSELQKTKEQAKCFKTELIDQVKELQEELMKNTAMTAELEHGSRMAKKFNEELEKNLEIATNKNAESKKIISELEARLNSVGEDKDEKDEKILNHKKNARNLRSELNAVQESMKTKNQDLESIKIKMADIEIALEKKTEEKMKADEELDRLKKLVSEKDKCINVQVGETEKLIKLKDELERLRALVQEKDKCLDSTASDAEKATKLSEDLERLKEKIKEKEELTAKLSAENHTLKSDLEKLKEVVKEKDELSKSQTEEISSIKEEMERLNELVTEKDELIEKHEGEMELMMKLKEKLNSVQEGMIKKETEILKLEDKIEELETVKKDLKDMVNKTTGDLQDKNIQLKDLEVTKDDFNKLSDHEKLLTNQIQDLKKQMSELNETISNQKSELKDKTTECKNLNTQISELTSKLNVQTTTVDQIKTELNESKSKVEQLQEKLNKSQASIKELETKLSERDSQLDNKAKNSSEIADKVLELTQTLTKQNNLVGEKEAEVKSINFDLDEKVIEIDELNQKLKSAEQTSSSLNDVIADLKSKQLTVDQTWQTTVSNLEKSNKNLEEKLAESKKKSSSVETNQKDLQEKISSLENSKKLLKEELQCFQSNLETLTCEKFEIIQSNEEKIKSAENSKKEVKEELKDVKAELKKVTEEKDDFSIQLTNQRQALEDFRNETQGSLEEMKDIVNQKETELNEIRLCCKELKNELPDTRVKIAELKSALHMEKTLQKKYKDEVSELTESKMEFEKRLANKDRELERLKSEEAKLEKEISKLGAQLTEEKTTREKLENKMASDSDHEKSSVMKILSSKDKELEEKQREISELNSKLESVQSEHSKLSEQVTKLSETGNKMADSDSEYLKSELQSEQVRAMKLEAAIKEYQASETDTTPGNARRLRKEKIEAESSLINAQYEIEKLTRKLKCLEEGKEIPSPVSDPDLLQKLLKSEQEIEKLQSKIKSLEFSVADNSDSASSVGKGKFESEMAELRAELKEKEQRIEELSIKTSKDNLKQSTTDTTLQELKRSQDRELNLRQQLKEAGETMKEHSENMAKLEDKLHTQRNELLDLQSKLKTLQNEKDDWLKESESHKVYEEKIQELKAEIERKNCKLESKHNSKIELRQTMEREKEKFEVALKDAQANEAVLESLKDALTEQEETMEKQDEILKKREDEIKLINSELEKMTDKYQNLLESSGGSGREIRELNKKFTKLESEKSQLEKENQTLKQNIEKREKDLKTRNVESQDLNDQISALKQEKSEMDAKLKKESADLDQFYKDLDKLKLEKESLEKMLKDNNKCSNQLDEIISAKSSLECDKTVLNKQKTDLETVKNELEKVNRELIKEKCELEKVNDELVKKMTEMKSSNTELEKERSSLQKSCDKLTHDKETLNKVIKENNNDIAELEKVLTESRKEVEEFKSKISEEVQGKVNQDKAENKTLIDDLKTKLRDKDSEIRKLNKEIEKLSTQIETMNKTVTDKEKEMETWRKSRDDLVGSLESLMKKQAAEIKDLKEQRVNQSRKDLIEELELKEERIRELEEQVEQAEVEVKHQTPTRGRCRKRSNIAGISIVEIDNMRKQLEKEREEKLIMQRNLQMMQKCKDSIISDIRLSNHSLQVEIAQLQGVKAPPTPPNPPPVIKLEPTFEDEEEDISDHVQLDATPTTAAKALRKGRKRGSANSTESEPLVPKTRRRGRPAATKIKSEPVDEDSVLTPIDLEEIKEEDNEEDTGSKRPGRKAKQAAKNKLGDTAIGSPLTRSAKKSESLENIVPDTPETETKPRGGRKKRILYNTDEIHITPPFECGNFVPSSVSNEQRTSSRLRGRKQSAV